MGFRSGPSHFASKNVYIYIVSTENMYEKPFDLEHKIFMKSDMREPHFYIFNDTLYFTFF